MKTKITVIIAIFAIISAVLAIVYGNPSLARAEFGVEDSGSTAGPTVESGSSGSGSDSSGGSRKRGGSRRIVASSVVTFSNIVIERAGTNSLKVSWTTTPASYGKISFGTASVSNPTFDQTFNGYESGSEYVNEMITNHSAIVFMNPGQTYYIRPVALTVNGRPAFGPEFAITPVADVEAPRFIEIDNGGDTDSPAIIDLSKATSTIVESDDSKNDRDGMSVLRAAVAGAGDGIMTVFKNLWKNLFAKDICPVVPIDGVSTN